MFFSKCLGTAFQQEIRLKNLILTLGAAGSMALCATSAMAALDDAAALDLMKKSGCATCHQVDKKLVGPAYKDVAAKRKADAGAAAALEKTVRAGSKDAYGPIPMPPNPVAKISDADLHALVEWILTK
jgi:cytochrome c